MLHKFQKQFKEFVMQESDVIPKIIISHEINAEDRLRIYRSNIFQNLTNALKIAYPKFVKLVGDEFFDFVAHKYISKYLPSTGALLEYGAEFPEFIKGVGELNTVPYASDFAKLEWLHHECHHCYQGPALTIEEMVERHRNNSEFIPKLRSGVKLFYSPHNLLQLWNLCETEVEQQLIPEENYLLICKDRYDLHMLKIEEKDFKFLHALEYNTEEMGDIDVQTASDLILKYLKLKIFKK